MDFVFAPSLVAEECIRQRALRTTFLSTALDEPKQAEITHAETTSELRARIRKLVETPAQTFDESPHQLWQSLMEVLELYLGMIVYHHQMCCLGHIITTLGR